jgi:hypothetical protein
MRRLLCGIWPTACMLAVALLLFGAEWLGFQRSLAQVGMAAPLAGDNGDNGDNVEVVQVVVTNTPTNTVVATSTPPAVAVATPIVAATPIAVAQPSPRPLVTIQPAPVVAAPPPAQPKPAAAPTPSPRAGGFPMELAPLFVGGGAAAVAGGVYLFRRGKRE